MEAVEFDEKPQPLTSTFADYAIPSAWEVPNIEIEHLEHPTPRIPGGMKGTGRAAWSRLLRRSLTRSPRRCLR